MSDDPVDVLLDLVIVRALNAARAVAAEDSGTIAERPGREWVRCAVLHPLRDALAELDAMHDAAGRPPPR